MKTMILIVVVKIVFHIKRIGKDTYGVGKMKIQHYNCIIETDDYPKCKKHNKPILPQHAHPLSFGCGYGCYFGYDDVVKLGKKQKIKKWMRND